jgi:hypothetical protein
MVQVLTMILIAVPLKSVTASERIYFSEIAWAGSSLSTADEWLELVNPTEFDVDLSGWKISGAGASDKDLIFPNQTIIPANGALLIANYDENHQNAAFTVAPGLVSSTVALSNTKMLIMLFDADGRLVDQAGDGSAPFAGYSAEVKASMIRIQADRLGDNSEAWKTCEQAQNMRTDDCGTPGLVDELLIQTVIEEAGQDSNEIIGDIVAEDNNGNNYEIILGETDTASSTNTNSSSTTISEVKIDQVVLNNDIQTSSSNQTIQTTNTSQYTNTTENELNPQLNLENAKRYLRINEVMAAPAIGKEWVELVKLNDLIEIDLNNLAIHDAVGRVVKLSGVIGKNEKYKVVEIPSSRLNNSGDSVHIVSIDGALIDEMQYQGHDKGVLLARDANMEWRFTQIATPGEANVIWMPEDESEQAQAEDTRSELDNEQIDNSNETNDASDEQVILLDDKNTNKQKLIRLNEIVPNPAQGKEWVELISFATSSVDLTGLELHDAAGRMIKLGGVVEAGGLHVIELSSARLNNGGDKVLLINVDGVIIDELEYTGSQKGFSYARMQNGNWKEVPIPTKGFPNFEYEDEEDARDATIISIISSTSTASITSTSQSATKAKATKNTTSAKATKNNQSILSLNDFTMLHQEEFGGMRLKLRGTVGTLPRHVSGRGFILLNHDGRGLLIRVPSYKKIPEYGSFITVTGSLKFDTRELPYLSLTKNDDWNQEMMNAITPSIRDVSLLSPASEDAWSLVQATGTVNGVSGNTVNLIVDNIDVDMTIKSGVEYRASRLKKGDVISFKGILDISNDRPTILPRHADEIILISHAPESLTAGNSQKQGIPGWTPFGAAAIAVGAVEGIKKFKQHYKSTNLKQILSGRKTAETSRG